MPGGGRKKFSGGVLVGTAGENVGDLIVGGKEALNRHRQLEPGGTLLLKFYVTSSWSKRSFNIQSAGSDARLLPNSVSKSAKLTVPAQAAVTADSLLVVATDVVQATNDKQQIDPLLGKLAALPTDLGRPQTLLGDTGYFRAVFGLVWWNKVACRRP